MMAKNNKTKKVNKKSDEVTFLSASTPIAIHKTNPIFAINKSDLIIYLGHFKEAVIYKINKPKIQAVLEVSFYWAIFFTSSFANIGFISGNMIKYALFAIASMITYGKVSDLFSTDNSKYQEINEEKMANIIENSCNLRK